VNRVAVLTPAGTGAIATVAVVGREAWPVVRSQFRPANEKPLPDPPAANQFWLGTLGDGPGDEVVIAVKSLDPEPWVEVHCHGGRRVVRWVVEQFVRTGCTEVAWNRLSTPTRGRGWACDSRALEPLTKAPTLRTASILLDQHHDAFNLAITTIIEALDWARYDDASSRLHALADRAPVGRHLVTPWRVVIAGAPNVGKSSLVNALAGYQRTIVATVAGTTRDVVTTTVALDGWPVELADTAGLREEAHGLEADGIARAWGLLPAADLVVWVLDATVATPTWPDDLGGQYFTVVNKADLPHGWDLGTDPAPAVSAATGAGIPELTASIIRCLVRTPPAPGAAVPFTPELADAVETARRLLATDQVAAARETLVSCLSEG
jgi:tRNA modification GTPase